MVPRDLDSFTSFNERLTERYNFFQIFYMLSFCTISPLSDFCELCEFVSILIGER